MTYTDITSSTLVSGAPDILNGVKTRTVLGALNVGPATSAVAGVVAGVHGIEFSLNDKATLVFPIPERVDKAVAPVLRLTLAPTTSEVTKECEFTFASDTVTAAATPVAGTGAQSTASADIALSGTLGTMQIVDTTLTIAVFATAVAGTIVGVLSRTAITDGVELTGDVSVISAALVYTIER